MKATPAKTENQFAAIFHARTTTGAESAATTPARARAIAPAAPATEPTATATAKRTGRPAGRGKSSDPSFKQVTAYIPQELHSNAAIALRLANRTRVDADKEDFSDLLTRLVANWFEQQEFYRPRK